MTLGLSAFLIPPLFLQSLLASLRERLPVLLVFRLNCSSISVVLALNSFRHSSWSVGASRRFLPLGHVPKSSLFPRRVTSRAFQTTARSVSLKVFVKFLNIVSSYAFLDIKSAYDSVDRSLLWDKCSHIYLNSFNFLYYQ